MGTTAQKLQKLLDSKAAIKAAIEAKTGGTAGDVMADYANQINNIPTPDYEVVNIKLTTNQGTDYGFASATLGSYIYKEGETPIYNVVVKVDGESASRIFSYTGLVISTIIAKDKKYTVSLEFRNKPIGYIAYSLPTFNADGYTAIAGNVRNITGVFSCEKVTVKLVNEQQKAITEQTTTVTIGSSGSTTSTKSDFVFGVPTGQKYTVSFSDRSGYDTPASQTYTANQQTREITGIYKLQKLGVFILDGNNNRVNMSNWSASMGAIGIVVSTSDCSFVIHPDVLQGTITWIRSVPDNIGLQSFASSSLAVLDFNGLENTEKLLQITDDGTVSPANACNQTTINGVSCYLPSAGELQAAVTNITIINAALRIIGKTKLLTLSNYIWTSTYYQGDPYGRLWVQYNSGSYVNNRTKAYYLPIAELKSNN